MAGAPPNPTRVGLSFGAPTALAITIVLPAAAMGAGVRLRVRPDLERAT